jgi:hypothetical protein
MVCIHLFDPGKVSNIAVGQMKLHRSLLGLVQTYREVDRLFLAIKRLPFAAAQPNVLLRPIGTRAVRSQAQRSAKTRLAGSIVEPDQSIFASWVGNLHPPLSSRRNPRSRSRRRSRRGNHSRGNRNLGTRNHRNPAPSAAERCHCFPCRTDGLTPG